MTGSRTNLASDATDALQADANAPDLCVVIPAYNEEDVIGQTLDAIRAYGARCGYLIEVVVADDGSTDATAEIARRRDGADLSVRVPRTEHNHGKGHAVARGMLATNAPLRLMYDADGSTPIEAIQRLLPWVEQGYDVVIGSRDVKGARLDPPQPLVRRVLAGAFRALRRRCILSDLHDTQCGFKLFRGAAADSLFALPTTTGWLFDCEILLRAEREGYRVREVGVHWRNRAATRVRVWREIVPTLIWLYHARRWR